ncbi:carbohydrate ABC transporter membrane protein 2 (CUT1 family) [Paramicrobacterium agarici]|uniref:Carbohydrate ABC transporter membrane protein 2 (CUT1 family) n=1 Tax=Paramicrobacterium agarici TaxID=630514 RepID=A0A2A9DT08_9MICO|nr:carbohydrate ABC transporter membrane protein 2 (CUT1 family) [Microbacterium agarici]
MTSEPSTRTTVLRQGARRPARQRSRGSVLVDVIILITAIATVIPIAWTLFQSFLPNRAIVNRSWDFPFWIGNFTEVLSPESSFIAQIGNSLVITAGTVLLCLILGALSGYALSRLSPSKWLTIPALVLAAFLPLVPPMTLVPGLYLTMGSLGLLGSNLGLIFINTLFNLPFAVLLLRSFFSQIPEELREAALVDGASEARAFFSVALPLVRPGLASVGIYVAIMAWNEFLFGLTMTSGGPSAPLTVGIASLVQPFDVTWGEMAAAGTIAAVPIVVLAIVANRYIVTGMTAGAVKG